MFTKSVWNEFASLQHYPELQDSIEADVAIIGGGVTGISTAHLLSSKGLKVVVLESLKIGGGTSSHSTGNLYYTVDKNLAHLYEKYNNETVKEIIASRTVALDLMEKWIEEYDLDCDFKRQAWYLYSTSEANSKKIEKEYEHAKKAGVDIHYVNQDVLPMRIDKAIRVEGQAQINPMRYVQELARTIQSENCIFYEHSRVTQVEEEDDYVIVKTAEGEVKARYVVHATHIPKGVKKVQTLLSMYREYGIACPLDANFNFPGGIFWGYHEDGKKFSTRLYERNGQRFLLVIGEPHRVGQIDDNKACIEALEQFAKEQYGLTETSFRWGGQHYKPADLIPYIGRESKDSRVFIATGYSTDGLVYGTLAAMLITDEITQKKNNWAEIYSAHRLTPLKSAVNFIKEGMNTVVQYIKDMPGVEDIEELSELKNQEGAIIEIKGEKIAAYRDAQGVLHLNSAVCTHLKCIVNWNNAEKTWDCPCHASRFDTNGNVLEGPAYDPLNKIYINKK